LLHIFLLVWAAVPLAASVRGKCRWGARLQTIGPNDALFLVGG
jgi:hypothetical protein